MFHQISSNHFLFMSEAFCKDAIAFNLMTTILADTQRYPDTKCFSDEKQCILVNTDNQHPILVWTSDDFQDFQALHQFIQTEFRENNPLSIICKESLFNFYKEKNTSPFINLETMGVYQYDTSAFIQYIGFADNIKQSETELLAEMIYQFYRESNADNQKSIQSCIREAQKFVTESNYKVWRNQDGKIVSFARYHISDNINRIGLIYTLPEERGKSYAKMLVQYLTQIILQDNKIPVLYTDFNYQPSNQCYTAIGYKLTNKIYNFTIQNGYNEIKIIENTLYKGNDDHLLQLKEQTAELLIRINTSGPREKKHIHQNLFPKLFNKFGTNTWIEIPFHCDYGQFIEIGNDGYINHHCTIGDGGKVKIGNNVMIGPNVSIYTAEHPLDPETRQEGWQYVQNVIIEDNVWIGGNCVILAGVTIGKNSIIGAGSVVTKNMPENVLAYGNPCQVIKVLKPLKNK